ncbi:MAG: ABC-F family ATP-binding cassette domain-containing protein [Lachnospiraceae bacterium]|nr:ABC-F family ATP-binding cassette domain-containing protein [Lachnospiraceae bacterium]
MILSAHALKKSFREEVLFEHAGFHIEEKEKAAIVGPNGCGKTTLVRMLMGLEEADEGTITFSKDASVGYLAQHQEDLSADRTIYEELLTTKEHIISMQNELRSLEQKLEETRHNGDTDAIAAIMETYEQLSHKLRSENGYAYESEIMGVLNGLGFTQDDCDKKLSVLSGGQKTRIALGKILLTKPDLIILDEPTNHLDMDSIRWLETYLMNYRGAVLLISHDRYFLDRIVTKIIEIDAKKVTVFSGNYSAYADKKALLRESEMNAYLNNQREIRHQEAVIDKLKSFNREKSIKRAESRQKALDKIERVDRPETEHKTMHFSLTPRILSGNDVCITEGLKKAYGDNLLFSDVHFTIRRGEHVAMIGRNGTGKTTILKILNEVETQDAGSVKLGTNVEVGYYDQEHHVLDMNKTIFDEISDAYPQMTGTEIRNMLAAFLFTGEDVFKKISALSGGERGRVSLAKLMLSSANFLILDEPTNHLDMESKEILEHALNHYEGTLLYVSHDRYFINRTAHRILDLENGSLVPYEGNYDYYIEKHGDIYASISVEKEKPVSAGLDNTKEGALSWQEQKQLSAKRRKLENTLEKTESEIETCETSIEELHAKMAKPEIATDVGRLNELSKEADAVQEKLDGLYALWEETSEALESLEQTSLS